MLNLNDITQTSYNKFSTFSEITYNCIKYMMDNNDSIWKLLYYPDPDAWNKPNLTSEQKAGLIYNGTPEETNFRIFADLGQDNAWTVQACILRISPTTATPRNHVFGSMSIGFEIYSHYRCNTMSNYKTRIDSIAEDLISVFNGADVSGIGRIYFDSRASSNCKMVTIGGIPYKGRGLILCTQSLG